MKFITKQRTPRPTAKQRLLLWSRYVFFFVGVLVLGYVAVTLLEVKLYQTSETRRFQLALKASRASGGDVSPAPSLLPPVAGADANQAKVGNVATAGARNSPLGRIEISSIGVAAMILEGVDSRTLRRAIGHIPGTAFPGQRGNVGLAGHRDTFFRALRNIRKDDEITLETLDGSYRYRVDFTRVVAPEYIEALSGSEDASLTLVTCYPFSFVGPAPQRFIVRAHRVF